MADQTLTDKQKAFLEALFGEAEGNVREAMDIAGYAPTVSANTVLKALKQEITEGAELIIAQNSARAAFGIVGVLNDPTAMGAQNKLAAAKELLDRAGLVKKDKVEVTANIAAPIAWLPKKNTDG